MGMYTELCFTATLARDTPIWVIDTLSWMGLASVKLKELPKEAEDIFGDNPRFFRLFEWSSYYFDGEPYAGLITDPFNKEPRLTVRFNMKNYDGEIHKFLTWIRPFCVTYEHEKGGAFKGYVRYETECHPTLIYFTEDAVVYKSIKNAEIINSY